MFLKELSDGGIAHGDGVYLYLPPVHPGAVMGPLVLEMGVC